MMVAAKKKNEVNDLLLSEVVVHISPGSIFKNKSYLLLIEFTCCLLRHIGLQKNRYIIMPINECLLLHLIYGFLFKVAKSF